MRVSVVGVAVCCVVLLGYVSAHRRTDTCWEDAECDPHTGQYCFCLKSRPGVQGHCVCQIDPSKWRPQPVPSCYQDLDCEHLAYGAQACFCDKTQYRYIGQCKCINALLR